MQHGDLIQFLADRHSDMLLKQAEAAGSDALDVVKRLDGAIAEPAEETEKVAEDVPVFADEDFLMAAVLTYADAKSARSGK